MLYINSKIKDDLVMITTDLIFKIFYDIGTALTVNVADMGV